MIDQQLNLPLSGDVSQQFSFWNMFNSGGQIGLINVNLGASANPALEREIMAKVGTYGRQIGQITDALTALFKQVRGQPLEQADTDAIELFEIQARMIALLKRGQTIEAARAARAAVKARDAD